MRNKRLLVLLEAKDIDSNFSRSCVTHYEKCKKCSGKMSAVFFDREAVFEQLEEYMCKKCKHIEPFPCGYPRFMETALTAKQGKKYYNKNKPY
jgi:hypothetical protein